MRLSSLDVFRGITIAAMILANMAGVADDVYRPLSHSEWDGCTPTDLIFPCFLFIVGVAMTFSLAKYTAQNKPTKAVYLRILRRTAILFILGLVLNGFWNQGVWTFDLSSIRLMGILQRIALTYLFASLIVLKLPRKSQWLVAGGLLIAYWLTMMYIPVPDYGAGVLTREGNFGAFIDRLIIPKAHLYKGDGFNFLGDPEGLFSTIPAIVSVLAGYFTGQWIKDKKQATSQTSMDLVLFGLCCLVIAIIWDVSFPINKKIWTSSYVLFTTGWALMLLAACYELIEVRLIKRWSKPFEIMGLNAIALFVASVFLIKITAKTQIGTGETAVSIYNWIYQNIFASWAGNFNGSFLFALVTLLFWYGVAVLMYQKRWFIKV
ncbi:acyltransferase family protein [Dolichospermum sp. UHCC 0352]|uniref:acyltransferase family protein n=1 Tax=Dolichospermum sp. UHCC 0352 TaxID=2590011 RepID=UPI00144683D0|nr:acyltransferase family protein [Dolichospermum sp. UHCC 0352]MTJ20919.1 acyltransferase family protein [Dolichospermum sp. UHCC 0352]